ncbi:hypothetical protein VP01_4210g1 [Puccinia sorghi]|uniref:Uncharacterized protein n=1 Tax=Puccinia sorghi TaxID=27349 RepID=A0A0L6UQP3_9BASI|nr:hypothetical protein VP01_4210g1 [Puccinia sorghi]
MYMTHYFQTTMITRLDDLKKEKKRKGNREELKIQHFGFSLPKSQARSITWDELGSKVYWEQVGGFFEFSFPLFLEGIGEICDFVFRIKGNILLFLWRIIMRAESYQVSLLVLLNSHVEFLSIEGECGMIFDSKSWEVLGYSVMDVSTNFFGGRGGWNCLVHVNTIFSSAFTSFGRGGELEWPGLTIKLILFHLVQIWSTPARNHYDIEFSNKKLNKIQTIFPIGKDTISFILIQSLLFQQISFSILSCISLFITVPVYFPFYCSIILIFIHCTSGLLQSCYAYSSLIYSSSLSLIFPDALFAPWYNLWPSRFPPHCIKILTYNLNKSNFETTQKPLGIWDFDQNII